MKFIANASALAKQLQKISGIVGANSTLPILNDLLFDIHKEEMQVHASDLETTMTINIGVESRESGSIAIPAKLFVDFLKKLPDHPVTINCDLKNYGVEIISDYGKYKLVGHDPEEFPKIPSVEGDAGVEISSSVLGEAIEKTVFATGSEELRPAMSGVLLEITGKYLTFAATDSHRLVRYRRQDAHGTTTSSLIIPKKPLNALKGILKEEETGVKIAYNKSHVFFSFGNISVICRLIDGKYPNYESVIPENNPNQLTVDRSSFASALERVSLFSNKSTFQVRLKLTSSEMQIFAEDLDFANEATERLSCSYSGEELEIGFNAELLVEMLKAINSKEVTFELSTPNRAGILLPVENGKEKKGSDLLMLIMPMMVNT